VQGNWTYGRKKNQGSFHAAGFNSLVCSCEGVAVGRLCNPGDRVLGPEPPRAPANQACFSGIGNYNPNGGPRTNSVAFRVEVEDHGEPGGTNGTNPSDAYRIRIWFPNPTAGETAANLAKAVCCENAAPELAVVPGTGGKTAGAPDVDDGGNLVRGNIQIHPELNKSVNNTCPPPSGVCTADD